MPISERDWWRDEGASWMHDEDEFEEPPRERPSIAWTLWQLIVLAFLALVIVALPVGWLSSTTHPPGSSS
jgi:hypothetical protein